MPTIEIKGVGTAQFPDNMGAEDIRTFLQRKYSDQSAVQNALQQRPAQDTIDNRTLSLSERMGNKIGDALYDSGIISNRYGAKDIGANVSAIGEFLPGIGDATAGDEFGRAMAEGDKLGMGLGALGMIPLAGDAAKKAIRTANKELRGAGAYVGNTMDGKFSLTTNDGYAGKFDTPQDAVNSFNKPSDATGTDYRITHTAPVREGRNTIDDLSDAYPDDIYNSSVAGQYYGHGGPSKAMDNKSAQIISGFRGQPEKEITIYRAVPKGVEDINKGDWITINKDYANSHGDSWVDDGNYDVISKRVLAKDIATDGNSIHEFGYDPQTPKPNDLPMDYASNQGEASMDAMMDLIKPKGKSSNIGAETGKQVKNGVSTFKNPYGSTRYVMFEDGEPVSALQVMSRDGKKGTIANVFTTPSKQKKGLASKLMKAAKGDFDEVRHSEDLTVQGAKFANSVER